MKDLKKYAEDYQAAPFEDTRVNLRRKFVLEQIQKYPHDKILEIGCGMEPLFRYLSDFTEMTIVEPSDLFIANAKRYATEKNKINFVHGFLEDCIDELRQKEYDIIVASALLCEVEEPGVVVNHIKQLCSHRTIVHINVPNAGSFHRLLGYELGIINNVNDFTEGNILLQQNTVFSIELLCELLTNYNFTIIDQYTDFIKPFSHTQMQRMIDNSIIDDTVLSGLSRMTKYLPNMGSEIYVNCRIKK